MDHNWKTTRTNQKYQNNFLHLKKKKEKKKKHQKNQQNIVVFSASLNMRDQFW